jgi:hypothetical protein
VLYFIYPSLLLLPTYKINGLQLSKAISDFEHNQKFEARLDLYWQGRNPRNF